MFGMPRNVYYFSKDSTHRKNYGMQRSQRRHTIVSQKPPKTVSSLQHVSAYDDFVKNTSLLGVQHFLRKKSFVWLIAYFICVSMSIVQSWRVTVIFFEQSTFLTSAIESKTLMPFPSVTVCSNTVLREDFNFSRVPGFNVKVYEQLVKDCANSKLMKDMSGVVADNKLAVRKYLRTLSEKERISIATDLRTFVKKCKFGPIKCNFSDPKEVYIFSHTVYGNCFTFNPVFEEALAKFVDMEDLLALSIYLHPRGYWLAGHPRAKASIHIHAPGTAPLMELPEVLDAFGGNKAELFVTMKYERTAIKKWKLLKPTCVDEEDYEYQRRSRFYNERTPYKYSLEACMKSCAQDIVGRECGTINRFIPVQSAEYESGKKLSMESTCRAKEPINMLECDCPIPCRYVEYDIIRDDKKMNHIPCSRKSVDVSPSPSDPEHANDNEKTDFQNEAFISVGFRSNVYERIREEFYYTFSEYLGILGGNMSLWIGLCIISLLELVELAINLLVNSLKTSCKLNQHKTSHFLQPGRQNF